MPYRLVIFDMDGTLTEELLDFPAIRAEIGVPTEAGILEHLAALSDEPRRRAQAILDRHELAAAHACVLRDGAADVLAAVRNAGLHSALLTRNSRPCAQAILRRHNLHFDHVATRDDPPHKPHPESILQIVRKFALRPTETLMVGDYLYDLQAARAAGTDSALLLEPGEELPPYAHLATHRLRSLRELPDLLTATTL